MAAWLSLLCTVDDLVERKAPQTVRQVLRESVSILKDGGERLDSEPALLATCLRDKGLCWHTEDFLDRAQLTSKIRQVSQTFYSHVRPLLSESTYSSFSEAICNVWTGLVLEADLRQDTVPTVDTYMDMRSRTIGLAPFFALLADCTLSEHHSKSDALAALEHSVSIIVGLQNDLLGLEKDLDMGEVMNFVVVVSGGQIQGGTKTAKMEAGQSAIKKAIAAHNSFVEIAIQQWNLLRNSSTHHAELSPGNELIAFIERHLVWSNTTERYQAV